MTHQEIIVLGLHDTKTVNFIDFPANSTSDDGGPALRVRVKIKGAPGHFITTLIKLVVAAMHANGWEVVCHGDAFVATHQQLGSARLANFSALLNFAHGTGAKLGDWSAP